MDFSYKGLLFSIPDDVYFPADDSILLADAAAGLSGNVLEIGCGCGIASLVISKTADLVTGVDINPEAVICAKANAEHNKITNADFIKSDLFSNIEKTAFDAILFNPPYLPTKKEERLRGSLNYAFDGGDDGRATIDRFLKEFNDYLKPQGMLLLVQSTLNDYNKTCAILENLGYRISVTNRKDFFFESLLLLRAIKHKLQNDIIISSKQGMLTRLPRESR